ncbi:hypothetical protein A9Q92_03475 [Methylophaga sp. 42_8_T64]|nr:hypothetical protein A9Q92_03475 [Methylophaga sp. 42_8_T64]
MNTYLVLKTLHIIGAVLFLGNIIVTGWWKIMANRTGNPIIIAFAQRQVTLTDFVFTAGGSTLLFGAGIANVILNNLNIMTTVWLAWGLGLFTLSGIIWAAILIPIQIKQAREAKQFTSKTVISKQYWRREMQWYIYGIIATILPLISVVLMVLKPS